MAGSVSSRLCGQWAEEQEVLMTRLVAENAPIRWSCSAWGSLSNCLPVSVLPMALSGHCSRFVDRTEAQLPWQGRRGRLRGDLALAREGSSPRTVLGELSVVARQDSSGRPVGSGAACGGQVLGPGEVAQCSQAGVAGSASCCPGSDSRPPPQGVQTQGKHHLQRQRHGVLPGGPQLPVPAGQVPGL